MRYHSTPTSGFTLLYMLNPCLLLPTHSVCVVLYLVPPRAMTKHRRMFLKHINIWAHVTFFPLQLIHHSCQQLLADTEARAKTWSWWLLNLPIIHTVDTNSCAWLQVVMLPYNIREATLLHALQQQGDIYVLQSGCSCIFRSLRNISCNK